MYPSLVCVIDVTAPLKKPSRTGQARWMYWETRCPWASAQKGTDHKASRATIFKKAVGKDQRLQRDCFPANIFVSSYLQIVSTLQLARYGTSTTDSDRRTLVPRRY